MNSGLIAHRYADAFLSYVEGKGNADAVYEQVRTLLSAMGKLPRLRKLLTDRNCVSLDKKLDLLAAAVHTEPLCPELKDLLILLQRKGREEFFRLVLLDFLGMYREKRGIVMVQLTTARPQEKLVPIVSDMVSKTTGKTAIVNQKVDPTIVGGFIYESWGVRLDASVRRSLDDLRNELIKINKRLV